ncbi:MAG: CHAT domain-containing protein, partial [Acidimicrobiia bacterium]
MFAGYSRRPGGGGQALPSVVQLSISRYQRALPKRGEPLQFLVAVHEEGTGVAWQRNVTLDPRDERFLVGAVADLHRWSTGAGLTSESAAALAARVGDTLVAAFLGPPGREALRRLEPTAVLLRVDETVLDLPWELVQASASELALEVPFGRIVTTRELPRRRRDPLAEDPELRILAVGGAGDLAAAGAELAALRDLEQTVTDARVKVELLDGGQATRAALTAAVDGGDFDILHFAGHGAFADRQPATSALLLADGLLTADDVLALPWGEKPPYIVFSSACESARAGGRRRLVTRSGRANGLAAAFLAAGVEAYLGYFWPVLDDAAAEFAATFYGSLFASRNIGQAVLEARLQA